MSWLDQVNSNISITTGDGKVYTPIYEIAPITVDYNIAEFAFPEVAGSLVNKKQKKGAKHTLVFYFQGDSHLDLVEQFKVSADNENPWLISHPMYGSIRMQAASISYDSSKLVQTKVSATLIETILDVVPVVRSTPANQIKINAANYTEAAGKAFAENVDAEASDLSLINSNTNTAFNSAKNLTTSPQIAADYYNAFKTANANVLNYTSDALTAISAVQKFLEMPFQFEISVKERLNLLKSQFDALVLTIETLVTPNQKTIFENNAGSLVSGMVQSAINPIETDYQSSVEVLEVIDVLVEYYDLYVSSLNGLQSDNFINTDSYIPNSSTLMPVSDLVNYTVSELFNIALSAQQERILLLEYDSNVIDLSHRFYGPSADDSNITKFMDTNKIGLNELPIIKKGRKLVYFI